MYIAGIVLVIVGIVGIIGTLIWILVDNKKKSKQRQNAINIMKEKQYQQPISNNNAPNYKPNNVSPITPVGPKEEFDLTEGLSNNYPIQDINQTQSTNQNRPINQNINSSINSDIYQGIPTENLMTDSLFNSDVHTESLVYTDNNSGNLVDDGENYTENIDFEIENKKINLNKQEFNKANERIDIKSEPINIGFQRDGINNGDIQICPKCQQPVKNGAKFCSHCGQRLV
ncbi:MAG: zinc ribbon domain-containing protein [Intestinibacter bartlettii]|uniref:zinc ribbon domain-containing protein n=1 Tax=Intestinibacter bartlettii TaxID=261299 RepID=UPI0026EA4161|nr:zinc ribbon domain-containing protein [Intestinibacter bartlettii]MDO5009353.1 zinc ribbon domain-containing protein [Intestinibacter bartlettii]